MTGFLITVTIVPRLVSTEKPDLITRAESALRLTLIIAATGLVLYVAFHLHGLFQGSWGKGRETAIETALEQRERLVEIEAEVEAWESTLEQERPDVTDRKVGVINKDVGRVRAQAKALCDAVPAVTPAVPPAKKRSSPPAAVPPVEQQLAARALVNVFDDARRRWSAVMWEAGEFGQEGHHEPEATQVLWDSAARTLRPEQGYEQRDDLARFPRFARTLDGLVATCALIRLDRVLWGEHGVDIGRESFAAALADARARTDEAKRELERLGKLRGELREKQEADIGAISKSTSRLVVEQLPLAMLLILGFGIALLLAARTLGGRSGDSPGGGTELAVLISSGQLLQFSTVVILFTLVLVLALAGALEPDHTATLLASVAGYLLGTGIGSLGKRKPDGQNDPVVPARSQPVVASASTGPSAAATTSTGPSAAATTRTHLPQDGTGDRAE